MSFYTSLSGLNAAQTDLNVTSNNIANAGTVGFKSSTAQFGDLISSTSFQAQNSVVGQGTRLKSISQQFGQGSQQTASSALDMMISGSGFFVTKAPGGGSQVSYTRNGSFSLNGDNNVVDSSGNAVQVLPVDPLGNVTATGLNAMQSLHVAATSGTPKATGAIDLSISFPSDADLPADRTAYSSGNYAFNPNDPNSYNNASSTTIYDANGDAIPATVYYVRTDKPTTDAAGNVTGTSTWDAHMYVGDKEVFPQGTSAPLTFQFDSSGAMTQPTTAVSYAAVQPTGATAPLSLTVDYGSATKEGAFAFSTTASSQDGNTTGKLDNLSVDSSGLVTASYSDGTNVALGKVAVATFSNPSGLAQVGDTTWTATGNSGTAQVGEATVDGRGSISSGALEMSNVDLTTELVNLIAAQRNFQANAKAIDTDKQMISSIINLQ